MKGSLFPQWAKSFVCSLEYETDRYVQMISQKGHLTLISLVAKGLYPNDNTGGERSGLGDVRNEVFAYDDVA